jgi:hypothetical protein
VDGARTALAAAPGPAPVTIDRWRQFTIPRRSVEMQVAEIRLRLDPATLAKVRGVALVDADGNVLASQKLDESVKVNVGNTITISTT